MCTNSAGNCLPYDTSGCALLFLRFNQAYNMALPSLVERIMYRLDRPAGFQKDCALLLSPCLSFLAAGNGVSCGLADVDWACWARTLD